VAPLSQAKEDASVAYERYSSGLVSVFSELSDLFGNPRSHGEIYGLLFSSPEPLSMEEITHRLDASKGSVSQGLRALEDLGAVERLVSPDSRSAHYRAKLELKNLIAGFVQRRLLPRLEANAETLSGLESLLGEMKQEEQDEAALRLGRIVQWHERATRFLPLAQKLLETAAKLSPDRGS